VHQRFGRWAKSGVFERIFQLLASDADNEYMMIDAPTGKRRLVTAHTHRGHRPGYQTRVEENPACETARVNGPSK
jgi:hypothetical protein